MKLLNVHTHYPSGNPATEEIVNLRPGEPFGVLPHLYSAGLHPWFLREASLESDLEWLHTHAPDAVAVGEAGLDKLVNVPADLQMAAFRACIAVSEQTGKPLIIHCVKAYEAVMAVKKSLRPAQPWIIHGFDKHPQTAAELIRAGCYLSFGKALFNDRSHAARSLQAVPADRFFLETDDARDLTIEAVYARAALIRGVTQEEMMAAGVRPDSIFML
ncbi:MAG: TatD family hydrolase [Bacteroidota bacterium]